MSGPPHNGSASLVDEILAVPGFRGRVRHLSGLKERYEPSLVQAFVERCHKGMRRHPREAAQHARLAEIVAVSIRDEGGRVDALRALAQASMLHGRFRTALKALNAGATAVRKSGNESQLATLDMLRLQPLVHLGQYDEARSTGQRTLMIFDRLGDRSGLLRTHMALADLASRLDRPRDALRHHARAAALIPADGQARVRGAVAANRAVALQACNRFNAAARQFAIARELFEAEGCEHTVAQVDYNSAYAEALRGRYESALRRYAETEETFRRLKDTRHLALIDLERAEIHIHLNMPAEAGALAARAEECFKGLGMEKECAQAAELAGRAAQLRWDTGEAERCLLRAEARFGELGLDERKLGCVVQRAAVAARDGRTAQARRLAAEAETLLRRDANPLTSASVGLLQAQLDLQEGDATRALHRADTVRMDCRRVHAPWIQIEAHRLMAKAHAARDQLDEAILAYRHAIDALERYRGGVPPDEYMAAFLAGRSELYAEIVGLLVRARHTELAFEFAERAKSRALVDLLAGRSESTQPGARRLTSRRIVHLRERLNAIYQRLFRHSSQPELRSAQVAHEARQEAGELEQELVQLLREARLEDRESVSLEAVDATDLPSVQLDLEEDTALLEFFVTDDELFTFVVTRDAFHVVRRDVTEQELVRLVQRFRFHLSKFDREGVDTPAGILESTRANLAKLATLLLEPVAAHLEGRRLVIAPHGVLHHLPFHALPWGDGWVADRFEVVYTPSAAVYGFCRRAQPRADGPACILGLPDEAAPEIESEVRSVAEVLESEDLYIGEQATLERLREVAGRARILHVATHGMFRREQPMLSAIRLADTWINLYEIYSLKLDAELVVLSTCESGTADVTGGDEILGLTRGFLYAGARSLLASQWRVHDGTAAEFMRYFYERLRETDDVAAAHNEAMAKVRTERPHPYYWAPFFLTGRPVSKSRRPAMRTGLAAPHAEEGERETQVATRRSSA
ncbi:MAG: CHAT domain-containing protein [Planctomycetota bacterium]